MLNFILKQVIGVLLSGLHSYLKDVFNKKKYDRIKRKIIKLREKKPKQIDQEQADEILDAIDDIDDEL